MNKKGINYFIVIAAAGLMQWHSIQFWVNQVGYSGIGWSLMLEAVVIWYWWNNKPALALIASLLLLMGPMHEITQPALTNIKHQEQLKSLDRIDSAEIIRLENSLKTYERNSESRIGWSGRIDRIQKQINEINDQTKERISNNSSFDFLEYSGIALAQALALLIIMTAQALAISELRKKAKLIVSESFDDEIQRNSEKPRKKEIRNVSEKPSLKIVPGIEDFPAIAKFEDESILIDLIPSTLEKVMRQEKINQSQWCKKNNIRAKNLSLAKTHSKRLAQDKEVAPVSELKRICEKLGIDKTGKQGNYE